MEQKIEQLKQQFLDARTQQERESIMSSISQLIDEDAQSVAECTLRQVRKANEQADDILRSKLNSILPAVSMAYIAKKYFGKSRGWIMQRVNGNIVNGKRASFTSEELKQLNYALKDLSSALASVCVL